MGSSIKTFFFFKQVFRSLDIGWSQMMKLQCISNWRVTHSGGQNVPQEGKLARGVSFQVRTGEEEAGCHGHRVEAQGMPGEDKVHGKVHVVGHRVEESGEEDDDCKGQVHVSKRVLELSASPSVWVPDLDKDANTNNNQ